MEIIATETSFAQHEIDEWYSGEITDAGDGDDYGYGPTFKINVLIDDEDSDTWAMCSPTLSPSSKLWGWIKAIDPALLPEFGQALQYGKLPGRRVEVMFEQGKTRINVGKIRAEKSILKTVQSAGLKAKQATAAKAKTVKDFGPDESPF